MNIRVLSAGDAAAYFEVRLAVLQADPVAFITTAAEFAERSLESVAKQLAPQPEAVTFGAFVGGKLVGILTLVRETRPSISHRASLFGVGVLPGARGQGCGDALVQAALAQAQAWGVSSVHLGVIEPQSAARRLYERHGFVCWGTQPDAVRHNGQTYAEHHMVWLNPSAVSP